jgi:glycosyltransferase involved in cell wall biosynthesis
MMVSTSGVGGVVSSVKNLQTVLESNGHSVAYLSKKALLKRYDVVHVHISRKWAVVGLLLAGRLIAKRVVMTVHNGRLDAPNDPAARASLKIAHGVIFLNDVVEARNKPYVKGRIIRLTSLLTDPKKEKERPARTPSPDGQLRILLYAYRKNYEGEHETYGILWVRDNLDRFPKDAHFTVVDPTAAYAEDLKDVPADRLTYIGERTDFVEQLRRHDIYLRPTATDGMSVAVLESLLEGVPVVASDTVPRPEGVVIYRFLDANDCANKIEEARKLEGSGVKLNSVDDYLEFIGLK